MNVRRMAGMTVAVVLSATAGAAGTAAHALSLEEALTSAYRSNPKLLAQRAQLKVTDEGVAQAQANWRPTISIQAAQSYVRDTIAGANDVAAQAYLKNEYPGDSYGLTLSQPLYRGGRTAAQLRKANAAVKEGEALLMQTEEGVLLSVVTDYVDLARDQALLDLTARRENDARNEVSGIRSKLNGGEATKVDVATGEAALQDAIVAHEQVASQEQSSELAFIRDTGLQPGVLLDVPSLGQAPASLVEATRLASLNNFQVLQAEYAVRTAQAAVALAQGEGLPTITLQGTLLHQDGVTYPKESEGVEAISVQLKMPLYGGGSLSSQTRAAKLTLEQKHDLLDDAQRSAQAQAGDAFAQMDYTIKAESGLKEKSRALATTLDGVSHQQAAGERTLSDVIAAKEGLFAVEIATIQAHHDAVLSTYALFSSIGELTAARLNLPTELFDPDKYLHHIAWAPGR